MIKHTVQFAGILLVGTLLIAGCTHTNATAHLTGQPGNGWQGQDPERGAEGLKGSDYLGKLGYVWPSD